MGLGKLSTFNHVILPSSQNWLPSGLNDSCTKPSLNFSSGGSGGGSSRMMYRKTVWQVVYLLILILFPRLEIATDCTEGRYFSGRPGVPKMPPLLSTTGASKARCATACMQLAACKSFSFGPNPMGCLLFPRRIMALDLDEYLLHTYFHRIWASCPSEDGYVTVPGTTKCILVGTAPMNWTQAADACGAHGGHLLIIENADVMSKLQDYLPDGWYNVGFNDLATEDQHLWLDGTPVSRSLFYATEPSDDKSAEANEDCGFLRVGGSYPGLHDTICSWEENFLCSLPVQM